MNSECSAVAGQRSVSGWNGFAEAVTPAAFSTLSFQTSPTMINTLPQFLTAKQKASSTPSPSLCHWCIITNSSASPSFSDNRSTFERFTAAVPKQFPELLSLFFPSLIFNYKHLYFCYFISCPIAMQSKLLLFSVCRTTWETSWKSLSRSCRFDGSL